MKHTTNTRKSLIIPLVTMVIFGLVVTSEPMKILLFSDYEWNNRLRIVRIYFDTPKFDRITKDRSAKFVDMLSAIGGTMGLLTGFSIISGVEIMYFTAKIFFSYVKKKN